MMLNLYFNEAGDLVAMYVVPKNTYFTHDMSLPGNYSSITTECPDMRTALTVACAWERTGRKE